MLHRTPGTGAVAGGDDEGSGPGPGLSAQPPLCAALCQRGCAASGVPPCAGEVYTHTVSSSADNIKTIFHRVCFG